MRYPTRKDIERVDLSVFIDVEHVDGCHGGHFARCNCRIVCGGRSSEPEAVAAVLAAITLRSAYARLAVSEPTGGQVWTDIIRRWLGSVSKNSERSYKRTLTMFSSWFFNENPTPERALEMLCGLDMQKARDIIQRWIDDVSASGSKEGTVTCHVTSLRSALAACRNEGVVAWDSRDLSISHATAPRGRDRKDPGRTDVEWLISTVDMAAESGNTRAIRDAALLRLLYVAALRRSEATNLRIDDFIRNAVDGPVIFPRKMARKDREPVSISKRCSEAIERWLAVRGAEPGYLFVGIKGGDASRPMNGESVRRTLAFWANRAGIKTKIRPHGLRMSPSTGIDQLRAELFDV